MKDTISSKNTHVSNNSGNNEWYTPANIIELARNSMGSIDIDPSSCDIAQSTVKAATYWTKETNGLDKSWYGNVWMNPPYSAALIKQFCAKLNQEYSNGNVKSFITLTNNATETQWFKQLYEVSSVMCFLTKRVKFLDQELKPIGAPLQGQVLCFQGNDLQKEMFIKNFSEIGLILNK